MYAHSPHVPASPHQPSHAAHQRPMPPQNGFQHGSLPPHGAPLQSGNIPQYATPATMPPAPVMRPSATGFVTGAYEPSGDPGIDRMLRLEAALKRFSPTY